MKILIDGLDYTSALDAVAPLTVERKLNLPSTCRLWVSLAVGGSLAAPARNQSLVVNGDDETVYFTGYLAVSPLPEYAGLGLQGPVYRWALEAVSDEILLDTQLVTPSAGVTGGTASALMKTLVTHTGSSALSTAGLTLTTAVGNFRPQPGGKWSHSAERTANQARAAYRAVSGALSLTQVGSTVHVLSETNGSLELANLALTASVERALANDVTVCGEPEPVAYVSEYLLGDGVTASFQLSANPYFEPVASSRIINELFNEAAIDLRNWSNSGSDGYLSLTGGGLTMNGGTGADGQTVLLWNDPVEGGGTLLLETAGVNLSLGSTGTLAGLYSGLLVSADCVAGFKVTAATGTGAVSVQALVQGVATGPIYAIDPAQQYTFRVRVHCPEIERVTQGYRTVGDSGLVEFGALGVVATGQVLMEVQEFVLGVGASPVTLYDGSVSFVPGSYQVVPVNSLNLIGTMRSVFMQNLGSGWVVSTAPGAAARTRPVGTLAESAECELRKTGVITFYTGYIPVVGEVIQVVYRTVGRAVGRAVNTASQAALAALGWPPTAVWIGTATEPPARSSEDCRNAAQALVTAAASVSAAWSGTYKIWRAGSNTGANTGLPVDVWPGDALELTAPSLSLDAQVVVRQVVLQYRASSPDAVLYKIEFSNDWANDLAIKTTKHVPADAWLPAAIAPTYLANLNQLTVTAMSATALTVAANALPPTGGGFEVRRRDFSFQAGQDADLVLRAAVPNFSIPRTTEADRFYIRMYDGSTPPNYSEFSAALFVNLPLS